MNGGFRNRGTGLRSSALLGVLLLSALHGSRSFALQAARLDETASNAGNADGLPDAPSSTIHAPSFVRGHAAGETSGLQTSAGPQQPETGTGREEAHGVSAHGTRITGVVSDMQGGLVPGAQVTAVDIEKPTGQPGSSQQTTADAEGFFSFKDLPPGTYKVTIVSPGLENFTLESVHLKAGESYAMPEVALPIARTRADVEVNLTEEQLAEVELNLELKQRVLGILPNFYTSYQWDAAPLSARQKFKLTAHAALDPVFFGTTAITAGIEQANNTFPEYGGGEAGYWSRYGAAYGDAVIGRTLGSVVFASLFHQDPRYFVMTNGGIPRRAWHAVSSTFLQRGDNLHWQPAYAHLLGNATTGLIASTYHPNSSIGQLVLDNTVLGLGGQAVNNLIREFVLRHLAKDIPSYAKGKPPED